MLVSEETLERVNRAISLTGYVPNMAASNLASNRSMTVAAIIPVISASIFADAIHGLEGVLSTAGYRLFLGSTDYRLDSEEHVIRAFLGRRPDGFFVVGTNHTPQARVLLERARVPVVETWDLSHDPINYLVGYSNRAASEAITEHVISSGYRRPAFLGILEHSRTIERQEGFESTVRRLLPGEAVRVIGLQTPDFDMDAGRQLLHSALEQHPEADVLVFASDNLAAGALLECLRLGIEVPRRLAITGFGDFEISRHLVPSLTTVATPNREIGTVAGQLLLRAMSGEKIDQPAIDLGFRVVHRGSS